MMPDDATTLTRFDDFLDGIAHGTGADAGGLDERLVTMVGHLYATPIAPSPDPAFAAGLRRSLVQRAENVPAGPGSGAPLGLRSSPAARLFPTGRWWPRFELAAAVLVIGLLASVLAGGDVRRWLPDGSDEGGFLAAPGMPASTPEPESVAILFLIDKSGSMSYDPLGGTAKLEMEKETIRRAAAALPVGTTIGVIAFNERQEWVVPWTTIGATTSEADRRAIVVAVDAITAEGGSELPPALTYAVTAMRTDANTAVKHLVLLSDGKWRGGSEQTYRQIVGGAVQDGIVLSTIAFGDDADTATMQLLAEIGHGRYHHVVRTEDIPMLTLSQDRRAVEEATATPAA